MARPLDRRFATLCTRIHISSKSSLVVVIITVHLGPLPAELSRLSVHLFFCVPFLLRLFWDFFFSFLTIHSTCFFHANDTDITHIAWFLLHFPFLLIQRLEFCSNDLSIVLTVVPRFNLDVILPSPIKLSLYYTTSHCSRLSPSPFSIIFSQQHFPDYHRHAQLPRSHIMVSLLSPLQFLLPSPINCNETQSLQYSLAVAFPCSNQTSTTINPTPPFPCPLGLSTSTSITLSQPDRYDIQLRGQPLTTILPLLGYTICLDLSYPFRPVFSVQTHQSHRTYTYTYFLFSLYLSISILVVVVCIPRGLARNPKSPNRISPSPHHTPKLKSKAYPYLFFLPPDIVQPCTLQIAVL